MTNKETYQCFHCKKTFARQHTAAELEEEIKENFGTLRKSERIMVCDDCYKRAMHENNLSVVNAFEVDVTPLDDGMCRISVVVSNPGAVEEHYTGNEARKRIARWYLTSSESYYVNGAGVNVDVQALIRASQLSLDEHYNHLKLVDKETNEGLN